MKTRQVHCCPADIETRLVDAVGKERVGGVERVAFKHMHYHM